MQLRVPSFEFRVSGSMQRGKRDWPQMNAEKRGFRTRIDLDAKDYFSAVNRYLGLIRQNAFSDRVIRVDPRQNYF